jgi:hypothetical protein
MLLRFAAESAKEVPPDVVAVIASGELEAALRRPRYGHRPESGAGASGASGHRHGHRLRSLRGTFGRVAISVPRARLDTAEGKTTEWKSAALRAYQRRTKRADSLGNRRPPP